MTFGKTALRCWLPAAALLLALLCPLPVAAARVSTAIPVSVRTDGAAADAVYTVELTPLDAAPAPVQRALTVKNGGTVYFTGFAFDEPGDYRYLVAERSGGAAHTTYDAHSYTVTVRVTGRPDGGLAAGLWAVRSGETAKADGVLFVNRYDPPGDIFCRHRAVQAAVGRALAGVAEDKILAVGQGQGVGHVTVVAGGRLVNVRLGHKAAVDAQQRVFCHLHGVAAAGRNTPRAAPVILCKDDHLPRCKAARQPVVEQQVAGLEVRVHRVVRLDRQPEHDAEQHQQQRGQRPGAQTKLLHVRQRTAALCLVHGSASLRRRQTAASTAPAASSQTAGAASCASPVGGTPSLWLTQVSAASPVSVAV